MPKDARNIRRWPLVWPIAITAILIVAMLSVTTVVVVRQLASLPQTAADQAKDAVAAVFDLATAFRQGSATTRFRSFVTSVTGTSYLQVATIDRIEIFTREDRAAIFWGNLQLPEIVVSATVPVQYTAYVDLDESWQLELEDEVLTVEAPPIRFNRPSIDVAGIEFEIESDSVLRDEEAAIAALERELTSRTQRRARDLVPQVRETAREQIRTFVSNWLLQSFPDSEPMRIDVVFTDELRPIPPILQSPTPD